MLQRHPPFPGKGSQDRELSDPPGGEMEQVRPIRDEVPPWVVLLMTEQAMPPGPGQ